MAFHNFHEVLSAAQQLSGNRVAVACAAEVSVLEALKLAEANALCVPTLVGNATAIESIASEIGYHVPADRIVHETDDIHACKATVKLVKDGHCDILMKGQVHTAFLLKAILDKEHGLRTGRLMSHTFILELADRLLSVTDAAMVPAPDLAQKVQLINNAVAIAQSLDNPCPKVAILAAVEDVNPDMQATVDAAILSKMCDRGQIKGCVIDGPLQMDNVLSEEAARMKKLTGPVAGKADVVLCPDIHCGNALVKIWAHTTGGRLAGVLMGAAKPVVLTSRADSAESKMLSIATALLAASKG